MKNNKDNLLCRFTTFFTILCLTVLVSCNSREKLFPLTQTPFNSKIPEGQFLFIFVEDDDYTCLDGLCGCPISEAPAMPFEFRDGNLILNKYWFEPTPNSWIAYRKSTNSIVLYGDYSQWDASLQLFQAFPIETPTGKFLISGVNSEGEIQIETNHGYEIVSVGSEYNAEEPEKQSEDCKVLHKFTLTNYGFIKDDDVEFYTYE